MKFSDYGHRGNWIIKLYSISWAQTSSRGRGEIEKSISSRTLTHALYDFRLCHVMDAVSTVAISNVDWSHIQWVCLEHYVFTLLLQVLNKVIDLLLIGLSKLSIMYFSVLDTMNLNSRWSCVTNPWPLVLSVCHLIHCLTVFSVVWHVKFLRVLYLWIGFNRLERSRSVTAPMNEDVTHYNVPRSGSVNVVQSLGHVSEIGVNEGPWHLFL